MVEVLSPWLVGEGWSSVTLSLITGASLDKCKDKTTTMWQLFQPQQSCSLDLIRTASTQTKTTLAHGTTVLSKGLTSGMFNLAAQHYCFVINQNQKPKNKKTLQRMIKLGIRTDFPEVCPLLSTAYNTVSAHVMVLMMLRLFLTLAVEWCFEAPSQLDMGCCWPRGRGSYRGTSWTWWRNCSEGGCSSSDDPTWQNSCSSGPLWGSSSLRKTKIVHRQPTKK